jgi:transcriptional regulator GlxA family with amidase domain
MLRETNLTVAAVGYATGFNSPSRFALLFRRTTGTTPSAFRERVRDRGHR